MPIRSGHGKGKGTPHVEVSPVDELPDGVPAPARQDSPGDRGEAGRFAPGNQLSKVGGHARAGHVRLSSKIGLRAIPPDSPFRSYARSAASFRRAQCAALAASVGGGLCGPGPSGIIVLAARAFAWSTYASDIAAETGDVEMQLKADRLGQTMRQHLLAAQELCAREAMARANRPGQTGTELPPWLRARTDQGDTGDS